MEKTTLGKGLTGEQEQNFEGIFTQQQAEQICKCNNERGYDEASVEFTIFALNQLIPQDRFNLLNDLSYKLEFESLDTDFNVTDYIKGLYKGT